MSANKKVRGCLVERKGMYYVIVSYYVENCRKQCTKSTGIPVNSHRKREAQGVLDLLVREKELELEQQERDKVMHSFADCFERWINYKAERIESTTAWGYKSNSKTPIEYFRKRNAKIETLQPRDLIAYYEWALAHGRRHVYNKQISSGLSRRTVQDHAMLIKAFLNDAVVQGIITSNPAEKASVPKEKNNNTKEIAYMDKEQAWAFLKYVKSEPMFERLYLFSKLGLYYGLRRSELLGLKWSAIDFARGEIVINHTVVVDEHGINCRNNVKTKSSYRTLPLLEDIRNELLIMMERQKEFGIFSKGGYVLLWEDGRIYDPDYISKLFRKAVTRCGCVPVNLTVHGLRHSCCAILFEEGWEIGKVQQWLGHSDIATTANIYNHVSKKWQNMHGMQINNMFNIDI